MTRRRENPTERKLNVRWSTREWAPTIKIVPGSGRAERLAVEVRPLSVAQPKPRKRRQAGALWMRSGARSGVNGSRPTWR